MSIRRKGTEAERDPVAPPTGRRLEIVYRPLKELEPYANNARAHTPAQIEKLRASLVRFGWANPMLVAGKQMIAGHARLKAAIAMAEAGQKIARHDDPWVGPTVDLSHLSVAERRAYVLADNRLAEEAIWDHDLLRIEFEALAVEPSFDLTLTGFNSAEIESIIKGWDPNFEDIEGNPSGVSDLRALIKVRCQDEDADRVLERIQVALDGIENASVGR